MSTKQTDEQRPASASSGELATPQTYGRGTMEDPRWDEAGRVHDWRNYVPEAVKGAWAWLTPTGRTAVYLTADACADAEDWD